MNIAIKTHKRPEALREQTWKFLMQEGIKPEEVRLFVSGKEQADLYRSFELEGAGIHVCTKPGAMEATNEIAKSYPVGEWVLHLDDDIQSFEMLMDGRLVPASGLRAVVKDAITLCESLDATLWGIYPVRNAFYMKQRVAVGLFFIWAGFYGFKSLGADALPVKAQMKDDFERSLLRYLRDGKVVRCDWLCCKTKWAAAGGASDDKAVFEKHRADALMLAKSFPRFVRLRKKKGFGGLDVQLINPRG